MTVRAGRRRIRAFWRSVGARAQADLLQWRSRRTSWCSFVDRIQAEHLAYLGSLRQAGHIVTNGPVLEQPYESLRGLVFYRVGSLDEARRLAEQDPAVQAGRLAVEVMAWWCPAGSMTRPGRPVDPPD